MTRRLKLDDYTLEEHEANIYVGCCIRVMTGMQNRDSERELTEDERRKILDRFVKLSLDPFFKQWMRDNRDWLNATAGEWPAAAINQRSPPFSPRVD